MPCMHSFLLELRTSGFDLLLVQNMFNFPCWAERSPEMKSSIQTSPQTSGKFKSTSTSWTFCLRPVTGLLGHLVFIFLRVTPDAALIITHSPFLILIKLIARIISCTSELHRLIIYFSKSFLLSILNVLPFNSIKCSLVLALWKRLNIIAANGNKLN